MQTTYILWQAMVTYLHCVLRRIQRLMPRLESMWSRLRSDPLVRTFATALRQVEAVVSVETTLAFDDGTTTVGIAAPAVEVSGETAASCLEDLRGRVWEALRGLRADDDTFYERLAGATQLRAARAAVDMAWRTAFPAGAPQAVVATDATVSMSAMDAALAEIQRHVAAGFQVLKVKVGDRPDVVGFLEALTSHISDGCRLRVDPNQSWSRESALERLTSIADANLPIDFVEQPIPAGDWEGLGRLAADSPISVAADEAARDPLDVERLLEAGVSTFVLKSTKSGGETILASIARRVTEAGGRCIVSSMMEPPQLVSYSARLAAKLAPNEVHDLDAALWFSGGASMYRPPLVVAA